MLKICLTFFLKNYKWSKNYLCKFIKYYKINIEAYVKQKFGLALDFISVIKNQLKLKSARWVLHNI